MRTHGGVEKNERPRGVRGGWGRQTDATKKKKKNPHLRRVLSRGPLVLFQAQPSPRPGRRPSAAASSSAAAGDVHGLLSREADPTFACTSAVYVNI